MIRAAAAGALFLLLNLPSAFGQSQENWDQVKQIASGQQIRVTTSDHRDLRGTFQSATDDALMLATSGSQQMLSRAMVAKVATKGKSHRLRNTLIGAGAGAGGGLILGAVVDSQCHPNEFLGCFLGKNAGKEYLTPAGAAIGAIVGVLLPTGHFHDVYRAK
jgi:hypothetical protein